MIRIECPSCRFVEQVPEQKIPPRTFNVRCPQCKASFPFDGAKALEPAPAPPADDALELDWGDRSARNPTAPQEPEPEPEPQPPTAAPPPLDELGPEPSDETAGVQLARFAPWVTAAVGGLLVILVFNVVWDAFFRSVGSVTASFAPGSVHLFCLVAGPAAFLAWVYQRAEAAGLDGRDAAFTVAVAVLRPRAASSVLKAITGSGTHVVVVTLLAAVTHAAWISYVLARSPYPDAGPLLLWAAVTFTAAVAALTAFRFMRAHDVPVANAQPLPARRPLAVPAITAAALWVLATGALWFTRPSLRPPPPTQVAEPVPAPVPPPAKPKKDAEDPENPTRLFDDGDWPPEVETLVGTRWCHPPEPRRGDNSDVGITLDNTFDIEILPGGRVRGSGSTELLHAEWFVCEKPRCRETLLQLRLETPLVSNVVMPMVRGNTKWEECSGERQPLLPAYSQRIVPAVPRPAPVPQE